MKIASGPLVHELNSVLVPIHFSLFILFQSRLHPSNLNPSALGGASWFYMRCMQVVATAGNSVFSLLLVLAVLLECASGFGPAVPTARVFTSWLERNRSPRRFTLRGGTADETSMSSAPNEPLVSCEWLKENLDKVSTTLMGGKKCIAPCLYSSVTGSGTGQSVGCLVVPSLHGALSHRRV
jgi:hypothetical protein